MKQSTVIKYLHVLNSWAEEAVNGKSIVFEKESLTRWCEHNKVSKSIPYCLIKADLIKKNIDGRYVITRKFTKDDILKIGKVMQESNKPVVKSDQLDMKFTPEPVNIDAELIKQLTEKGYTVTPPPKRKLPDGNKDEILAAIRHAYEYAQGLLYDCQFTGLSFEFYLKDVYGIA